MGYSWADQSFATSVPERLQGLLHSPKNNLGMFPASAPLRRRKSVNLQRNASISDERSIEHVER